MDLYMQSRSVECFLSSNNAKVQRASTGCNSKSVANNYSIVTNFNALPTRIRSQDISSDLVQRSLVVG
jgi:hypothetical protein